MVAQPPTPPPDAPRAGSSPAPPPDAPGAHIDDMNAPAASAAAPSITTLSDTTRDKVIQLSAERFGIVATSELLSYAANLATKDDLAALRTELRSELSALESRLTSAMRNQAIALISATAALQLATIGVVASLVA